MNEEIKTTETTGEKLAWDQITSLTINGIMECWNGGIMDLGDWNVGLLGFSFFSPKKKG